MSDKSGQGDIRTVREAMEEVLSPSTTSTLLFEALEAYGGDVPQTHEEVALLVGGALARVLERRLGAPRATNILGRIEGLLESSTVETDPPPSLDPAGTAPEPFVRGESTATVPTAKRPVSVVIVASGRGFESRMAAALGPKRVAPSSTRDLDDLLGRQAPSIVLVDAADFAAIEPVDLARALGRLPATTARVVWDADLPYGRSVMQALHAARIVAITFDRNEGIEPLLDLIRSRRQPD